MKNSSTSITNENTLKTIEEDSTAAAAAAAHSGKTMRKEDGNWNEIQHHPYHDFENEERTLEEEENDRQPLLLQQSSVSLDSIETAALSSHRDETMMMMTPFHYQYGTMNTDRSTPLRIPNIIHKKTNSRYNIFTRKTCVGIFTSLIIAVMVVFVVFTVTTVWNELEDHDDADDIRSLCEFRNHHLYDESCPSTPLLQLRHHYLHHDPPPPIFSTAGIQMYLHLFDQKFRSKLRNVTSTTLLSWDNHRFLSLVNPLSDPNTIQSSSSSSSSSSSLSSSSLSGITGSTNLKNTAPTLVIAGKMTIDGQPCNIGQYNLKTNEWSLSERIQLSLYNSYSGGEVYSLLANHTSTITTTTTTTTTSSSSSSTSTSLLYPSKTNKNSNSNNNNNAGSSSASTMTTTTKQTGSGELLVVGAFDTTYRNSQVTYCSVGMWDGTQLSKVGEGLCNSALSKGMKITTASLAGPQDVYVAGSFQTRTWVIWHVDVFLASRVRIY